MPTLYGPNGEELRSGLSPAEIEALRAEGVTVRAEGDGTGSGGDAKDTIEVDEMENEPDDGEAHDPSNEHDSDTTERDVDDAADPDAGGDGGADDDWNLPEMDGDGLDDDWLDVDETESVDQPDQYMEDRFDLLQRKVREDQSDIGQRKQKRDGRIADDGTYGKCSYTAEYIRSRMADAGIIDDLREEFRQIKSRDTPTPATRGHTTHVRNAVRHASGDYSEKRVYKRRQPTETGDRCVGVTVDLSGSMDEEEAKKAVAALALATEQINDDFTATGYRRSRNFNHIMTPLITAPGEDFAWDQLNSVGTAGTTPTAAAIRDIVDVVDDSTARQKCVIVLTDGKANEIDYDAFDGNPPGEDAMDMARREVEKARQQNIAVIGLAVGRAKRYTEQLTTIFGPDGYITGDMDGLHESLADAYKELLRTA